MHLLLSGACDWFSLCIMKSVMQLGNFVMQTGGADGVTSNTAML